MVPVEISLLDETCRTKAEYNSDVSFTTFAREFSFSAYSKGKDLSSHGRAVQTPEMERNDDEDRYIST